MRPKRRTAPVRGILALVLIAACAALLPRPLQAQISRYTVIYPSQITTGEYRGDYDIYGISFFGDGLLSGDPLRPRAISTQSFKELAPVVLPDREAGFFMVYTVEHNDSAHRGDRDILMRRINRDGNDLWGDSLGHTTVIAQSKFVEQNPQVVELSDGTLMVFYEVHYGPGSDADVDIAAVRVARNGALMWSNGVWVANSKRRERLSAAVTDGRGGAIAVLESSAQRDSLSSSDILAQHIDVNGMIGWKDSNEPALVAGSRHLERNATAVADGNNGVFVAYELEYVGGERGGDIDVFAQRISRYGTREWIDENNPPVVSSNVKAREHLPTMVRDSSGVIVAFEVSFKPERGKTLANVIGMQRLDSAGRPVWNGGKKSKLIGLREEMATRPQLLPDITGGAYLIFEAIDSASGNHDIYVQRIASDGDQIWGDGERPLPVFNSPDPETDASATLDETGGLVVVASRRLPPPPPDSLGTTGTPPVTTPWTTNLPGTNAIVAQRVALDGTIPWAQYHSPLMIVNEAYKNGRPVVIRE